MTIVGKILAFMTLLMSVATVAMIAVVFTTRTGWKSEYEKVRNVALVAEAAYKTEKLAHENDIKSRDSQIDSMGKNIVAIVTERDSARTEVNRIAGDLVKARQEKGEAVATHQTLKEELVSLKSEREILAKEAQVQRAQVLVVQKELNDQKLLATNNRIEADAQTAKARRLLDRVEELERNVTQLTNKIVALGGERGGSTNSLLNPPPTPAPRDVRGTVMAVGTGGLTIINIGSDSGLSAGNKLLVYRVDAQNPKNSIYLGEMIVSRTEPKQAAGQFYAKPFAKPDERLPQKGDVVATSLGSR